MGMRRNGGYVLFWETSTQQGMQAALSKIWTQFSIFFYNNQYTTWASLAELIPVPNI